MIKRLAGKNYSPGRPIKSDQLSPFASLVITDDMGRRGAITTTNYLGLPTTGVMSPPVAVRNVIDPTIGTPTVTAQSASIITIEWPVTMSSMGDSALMLTATLRDAASLGFAISTQVITTGIGLGDNLTVSFAGVNGMNGATPIDFVLRLEVA